MNDRLTKELRATTATLSVGVVAVHGLPFHMDRRPLILEKLRSMRDALDTTIDLFELSLSMADDRRAS